MWVKLIKQVNDERGSKVNLCHYKKNISLMIDQLNLIGLSNLFQKHALFVLRKALGKFTFRLNGNMTYGLLSK